jgi:hypothetical protein
MRYRVVVVIAALGTVSPTSSRWRQVFWISCGTRIHPHVSSAQLAWWQRCRPERRRERETREHLAS